MLFKKKKPKDKLVPVTWTRREWLKSSVLRVVLWALVGCGVVGLVLAVAALKRPVVAAPAPTATASEPAVLRETAGEIGLRAVVASLTGTREKADEMLPRVEWPEKAATVTNPTVTSAHLEGGVWVVQVAADVDGVRRCFQVPVSIDDAGTGTVLQLPSEISAPVVATPPGRTSDQPISVSEPVTVAASDFLRALLAGTGDITRYTSPGVTIHPITPPSCTDVSVTDAWLTAELPRTLQDGDTAVLRTRVHCTVSETTHRTYDYTIALTSRASRWEVTSLQGTPLPAGGENEKGNK